ncbi:uroporphyrinogen-III synthase [Kocuria varians]|uniref:uroporphyrinogen-III synthase n=1 Tax=Kocuria varians TaxID=1272 RepID=UPI001E620F7F|nr:uroporphyrinogen-III synthase [Kocuria varians]
MLITRDPAAAEELAALLRERGLQPCASPMLEAQLPADPAALRRLLLREAAAPERPTWLCVTSATTVRAFDAVSDGADWGAELATARRGGLLRVAAVGGATARALRQRGVDVDLLPSGASSAEGMLAAWPSEDTGTDAAAPRALVPVSALGSGTLEDGLRRKGYDVRRVTAYEMVPVPAQRPVRRRDPAAQTAVPGPDVPELDPETARAACARGEVAAVVVTAPSRAAALLENAAPRADVAWIAIGEPTARALRQRGASPVTATHPTSEALAAAVTTALARH